MSPTVEHIVPDKPLKGVRILVRLFTSLLLGVQPLNQFLVDRQGVEGQLAGHVLQPGLHLFPQNFAAHFTDDPASSDRRDVMVDRRLAAAQFLALRSLSDRLVRRVDAPDGEALSLLEPSADLLTHHFKVVGLEQATAQGHDAKLAELELVVDELFALLTPGFSLGFGRFDRVLSKY